ncbi:MAG TPA: DUF2066 domain-containing protein [Steroidobacteraceae bacterium]|nr:DUF2066 domain-containing protein [Steroidobacteraceae bacterium]
MNLWTRVAAVVSLTASLCCTAATVGGMYEATVPLTDRSESAQAVAFQDAMREVLVRVTGQRDAGSQPALQPLINDARRYVQQFRVVGSNQFFAGFDGAKVERAVVAAGQPLWGHQRPATLVWLAVDDGRVRTLVDAQSNSELKQALEQAAELRGLPLRWPTAGGRVRFDDVWNGSAESLRATAGDFGADAVLVGRARSSSASNAQVHWTVLYGAESNDWLGTAAEGVHGAADQFARVFSAGSDAVASDVSITVSGIADLAAYARVTDYLESLTLISALAVEQLTGDTVVYRAKVRGDLPRLARAIELGNRLQPQNAGADPALTGALSFRYRP